MPRVVAHISFVIDLMLRFPYAMRCFELSSLPFGQGEWSVRRHRALKHSIVGGKKNKSTLCLYVRIRRSMKIAFIHWECRRTGRSSPPLPPLYPLPRQRLLALHPALCSSLTDGASYSRRCPSYRPWFACTEQDSRTTWCCPVYAYVPNSETCEYQIRGAEVGTVF